MKKKAINECTDAIFGIYPELRRMILEAFDRQQVKLTRTQQTILLTMANSDILSMSQLAKRINTSNEQATRAVSQMISLGFMERFQNERNHRIVNIRLTKSAYEYLESTKTTLNEILTEASDTGLNKAHKEYAENIKNLYDYFA